MFKAMALICSVWIINGKAEQQCFTHMFKWEFESLQQCELKLVRYRIYEFCMAEGVYLRPLGATIYILAPYITTRDQMERVYAAIRKVLDAF